jgi:hypothetical protein
VGLLQLFVQVNWTGVPARSSPLIPLSPLDKILPGHDSMNPMAQHPALLAAAKIILVDLRPNSPSIPPLLSVIWALRCCSTLQAVLDEKSDQLYAVMASLTAAGREALVDTHQRHLVALFHIETARFHTLFHEVREMVQATEEAASCVGLSVKDSGALGKRTKYQVPVTVEIISTLICGSAICNFKHKRN